MNVSVIQPYIGVYKFIVLYLYNPKFIDRRQKYTRFWTERQQEFHSCKT